MLGAMVVLRRCFGEEGNKFDLLDVKEEMAEVVSEEEKLPSSNQLKALEKVVETLPRGGEIRRLAGCI